MIERPALARRPVALVATGVTALLLATAGRYDYHRDELYFRMLGRHPQWGYADQPPFTPLLARASTALFGDHVWAARIPAAFLAGLTAVLLALIAREVGGTAVAQTLAAAGAAGTLPLAGMHVLSTAGVDLPVWLGVLLFTLRALIRGESRSWLAVGAITGLGLYNKLLIILLLVCLAGGILLAGPRRVLLDRRLWLGAALAVVIGAPNLIYQIVNDFPQASMAGAVAADKGAESRVLLLPSQLFLVGVPLVPVIVTGFVTLLRDPRLRPARAVAVAYPLMVVVVWVTAGQPYYPLGLVLGLFAVGAAPVGRWVAARRSRRTTLGVAVALNVAFAVVFALPVLPADRLGPIADINVVTADQIGWPEYARQVGAAYRTLSLAEQQRAVFFTGNYGEAGALDRYGFSDVYSGHNELHHYGPPPDDRTVVVVVSQASPARVDATFGGCEFRGKLHNDAGVDNEETAAGVYLCRHLTSPWRTLWPDLQHYD